MEPRLGIYIHIPFCASKCGYCDFYSCAGAADRMADYQHALLEHIEESAGRIAPAYIDTVYFGGGTPSFYGAARLIELLDAVKATGRLLKRAEVTVEVNPDSVRLHDLRALHKAGFNRLSIGMQSANNDILKMIGRRHSFHQVEMAVKNARTAGFDNVSLDLIYGLPSQTRSDWADTLAKAIALRPEHISGYGLKLEEGTPMYELKDSPLIPSDDEQADMYLCMVDELRRYGYEQYEISNFSIPGYESRHNLKYWQLDDYMGFGPGAHSCIGRTRYSYVRDLDRYIAGVLHGEDMIDEYETIGDFERAAEYLMLGMRTVHGVSRAEYARLYRSDFSGIAQQLETFVRSGWAVADGERWHFTPAGFLISNVLIGKLLEAERDSLIDRVDADGADVDRVAPAALHHVERTHFAAHEIAQVEKAILFLAEHFDEVVARAAGEVGHGDVIMPDGAVDALVERAVAAAGIYPQLLAGSGLGLDLRARIHGRGRDVDLIGVRAALEREARLLGHVFMPVLAAGDGVDDEQMFHSSIPALSTK